MRTRYFVIAAVLVLVVGVGTGLVAYYAGVAQRGPTAAIEELQYVPRDAAVVAYANVHDLMTSEVRQKVREAVPASGDGQREFLQETGIDVERDIDRVVACLESQPQGANTRGLVLARGRFDPMRIESLMRQHGAEVRQYKGARLILARPDAPRAAQAIDQLAVSFLEPGLAAVGSAPLVEGAIDRRGTPDNVTQNTALMNFVRPLAEGNNTAWAAGRFDALGADGRLPPQVAAKIPAITWFSVSGRVDTAVTGMVRADARDADAAKNLREVVQGLVALVKLQSTARPQLKAAVDSLELGGTGNTVSLSFSVPDSVFSALGARTAPSH